MVFVTAIAKPFCLIILRWVCLAMISLMFHLKGAQAISAARIADLLKELPPSDLHPL